jgi:hypothetical protein
MRAWMLAGALVLVVGGQPAEARAGRGLGRLFSGPPHTSYRPAAAARTSLTRVEVGPGTFSSLPALAPNSGRVAAATAASAVVASASTEMPRRSEPAAQPVRPEAARQPPVEVARATRPSCAPERSVGGVSGEGTGFCVIN